MKEYTMKLLPQYFDYMKYGTKRIELRLNDEKRQKIKIGDIIIFEKLADNLEYLKTKVVNMHLYNDFNSLLNDFDISLLSDKSMNKSELLKVLNEIYPFSEQEKYGVIGIEIELI